MTWTYSWRNAVHEYDNDGPGHAYGDFFSCLQCSTNNQCNVYIGSHQERITWRRHALGQPIYRVSSGGEWVQEGNSYGTPHTSTQQMILNTLSQHAPLFEVSPMFFPDMFCIEKLKAYRAYLLFAGAVQRYWHPMRQMHPHEFSGRKSQAQSATSILLKPESHAETRNRDSKILNKVSYLKAWGPQPNPNNLLYHKSISMLSTWCGLPLRSYWQSVISTQLRLTY